jgi:glucose dehydrogenase
MFDHSNRPSVRASSPVISVCVAAMVGAASAAAQRVDERALIRAAPQQWLTYGRDYAETHYSPLREINTENVGGLRAVWTWAIPKSGTRLEAVPVFSDGVITPRGRGASSSRSMHAPVGSWRFDPEIKPKAQADRACVAAR